MQYINAEEAIKRLAAAQGIDVLNLIKGMEQRQEEQDAAAAEQHDLAMTQQMGQMLKSPIVDPTKNPNAPEVINNAMGEELVPPIDNQQPPQ